MTRWPKKSVGDNLEISAETWNAIMDMGLARQKAQLHFGKGNKSQTRLTTTVLIRNESGVAIPRFGILGISGVVIEPSAKLLEFKNNFAFKGVKPDKDLHNCKWVICQEPIPTNKFGLAVIDGVSVVKTTGTADFADIITDDVDQLSATGGPARVIYAGSPWSVVLMNCSGAAVHIIRFRIQTVDTDTRSVDAEVISVLSGQSVSGLPEVYSGIVTICDPHGCYFNEPEDDLLDRLGWAAYMQPEPGEAPLCQPDATYETPDPQWEVFDLCCLAPECG